MGELHDTINAQAERLRSKDKKIESLKNELKAVRCASTKLKLKDGRAIRIQAERITSLKRQLISFSASYTVH